jgi:hypothetical protein
VVLPLAWGLPGEGARKDEASDPLARHVFELDAGTLADRLFEASATLSFMDRRWAAMDRRWAAMVVAGFEPAAGASKGAAGTVRG